MDELTRSKIDAALWSWVTVRREQAEKSASAGRAQEGRRSSVTGGRHLRAIHDLVVDQILDTGASGLQVKADQGATLAGYYRAGKSWDLVVLEHGKPVLAVEYKSMSGSEGRNLNNRADEIFGMAEDARQAELRGILPARMRRAYVFIMGENEESTRAVGAVASMGRPDPAFARASYLDRMVIMCKRMRESGLFHFVWAVAVKEEPFSWREPDPEVGWRRFADGLRKAFPGGEPAPNPEIENDQRLLW